jgi:phage terminase Nu1 subunit (DNA packaging protein)
MATRKPTLLSLRQFALLAGVSHVTVKDWSDSGKLPNVDGKIPKIAGLAALRRMRREQAKDSPAAKEAAEQKAALQRAQIRERLAKAEDREIRLRQARGELVEVAAVQADAIRTAEHVRSQLLAMPPRLAARVAAVAPGPQQVALIEALIADEINEALEGLQKTRFGGAA